MDKMNMKIIGANPVSANLTVNNITGTGNRLNCNSPLSTNINTNSRQPGVIKHVCISTIYHIEPPGVAMSVQQGKTISQEAGSHEYCGSDSQIYSRMLLA